MKILVTGHKGFIGSVVYADLQNKHDVYGFDIGSQFDDQRYDLIVHLAARTLIRKSKEMPYEYFQDGLGLTMKFVEKARRDKTPIIFPTSGSISEPSNPYSLVKKHAVEWINLYRKLYDIDAYILKFYNIYGPTSKKGAVYLFTKAAIEGEQVVVYGDGSHKRDFVHVNDISKIIKKIANKEIIPGDYEVGSGRPTSVLELLKLVESISGKKLQVTYKDYILDEAESLYAKDSGILDKYVDLEDGIREVYMHLLNERKTI